MMLARQAAATAHDRDGLMDVAFVGIGSLSMAVIERFAGCDPVPDYRRVRDSGRSLPKGLSYVGSWIEPNFDRCFQLMEVVLEGWWGLAQG